MGKVVISVDLNPLSRTTQAAAVPIVDELTRALTEVERFVRDLKRDRPEAARVRREYDRARNLAAVFGFLRWRLAGLVTTTKKPRPRQTKR